MKLPHGEAIPRPRNVSKVRYAAMISGRSFPQSDSEDRVWNAAHKDYPYQLTGNEIDLEKLWQDIQKENAPNPINKP